MTHHAELIIRCPQCGEPATARYVAQVRDGAVCWSESIRCTGCAHATEADGGALDEHVRGVFCAAEGRWSAVIEALGARRLEVLAAVRALRDATPAEALQLVRERAAVADGARVEVEHVAEVLRGLGADVVVQRLPHA